MFIFIKSEMSNDHLAVIGGWIYGGTVTTTFKAIRDQNLNGYTELTYHNAVRYLIELKHILSFPLILAIYITVV